MIRRKTHFVMSGGTSRKFFISSQLMALFLAAAFLVDVSSVTAQGTSSNGYGGGAWSSSGTWNNGVPGQSDDVIIVTGDSVYTSAAVSCKSLTIQPGAKLVVNTGALTMTGDFSIGANAWFYDNYTMKAWPNSAASYTIDPASNFVLMASGASTLGSQSADSTFGNVYILRSGVTCSANLTIQGDLTINYNSTSSAFRGMGAGVRDSTGVTSLTHHVLGNVYLITGILSAVDGSKNDVPGTTPPMSCVWDIDGNVTVGNYSTIASQARFGPFSSDDAGVPSFGEINIGGNLTIVNGARLQPGNSTSNNSSNQGEINLKGNLTIDTSAAFATNSNGEVFSFNFVGNKTQTINLGKPLSFASTTHLITLYDTVRANSTVVFTGSKSWQSNCPSAPDGNGAFVVFGTVLFGPSDTLKGLQDFVLKPGATLGTANVNGIDTTVGSIQVSGVKTLPSTSNYTYNGTDAQSQGNALPSTMNNLNIYDTAGVTLAAGETVTGILTLSGGGKLMLGADTIFVSNAATYSVIGDTVSYIVGSLKRAQGTAGGGYLFPIGTRYNYRQVIVDYTNVPSAASNLTASFTASDPTSSGLPAGISDYWKGGYWTVSSSGTPGGVFHLGLYSPEAAALNTPVTIIGKSALSDPWVGLNLTSSHASTVNGNWIIETGVSSYGIYGIGYGTLTGVSGKPNGIPTKIGIGNFPNPFNPSTVIRIAVPKNAHVTLAIYNDLGQKVATLVDQDMTAGYYYRLFEGSGFASGVYFSKLSEIPLAGNVGEKEIVGKMIMLK